MSVRVIRNLVLRMGLGAVSAGLVSVGALSTTFAQPAAQATPTCTVPPQGIVVTIDLPGPGAVISPGANVVVQGVAYDTTSPAGPAIDRVAVFFGDRDKGGIFWGNALLQQPSPELGANLASAGWSLRSPTIPAGSGSRDIFAYAHSLNSGREASTSVQVFLGAAPTAVRGQAPTPVPSPLPVCTPTPAATATPTSTATPVPVPPTSTPVPVVSTPTPTPVAAAPLPAAAPPAAQPAAPAAQPPAAAAPPAVAPAAAAQPTAPRGGGVPAGLGLLVVGIGASIVGGGIALRRRERRRGASRD